MRFFLYIIVFFVINPLFSDANAKEPDIFLKDSVSEVSAFISENKAQLDEDDKFLRQKMNDLVIPKLDIVLMSRIVLGKKNWNSITVDERERFMSAFKSMMVRTYMKSLTAFEGEKIKFLPYTPGKRPDIAKVKSIYMLSEGEIPVSYRLKRTNDKWRVYDIVIDGISLLRNYRSDFKSHVGEKGINSLIQKINTP